MDTKRVYQIKIDGIEQNIKNTESLGSNVAKTGNAWREAQKALKDVKAEMVGLDKNSKQWQDLAKVAGDYKDRLDDISQAARRFASDTKGLDDAINIGQSMTSVFTLAQGAMSAFGLSTDGVVESIQKLQGAMAIIQSLQSLQNTLKGSTATTDALAKAQLLLSKAMGTGSVAAKTLRGALLAIPLMLIIGLVTELVLHWEDVVGWFEKTFPILNNLTQKISAFGSALKKFMIDLPSQAADVLKKLFSGKFQEAMDSAKNILSNFKNNFWSSYQEEMTVKAAKEGIKRTQQEIAELEIQERNNKTHSKKLIELKKKEFEQRRALAKGNEDELNKIKLDEMKFFADVEDKKTKVRKESAKQREKIAKEEAKKEKEILDDLIKAERKAQDDIQKYRQEKRKENEKKQQETDDALFNLKEAEYQRDLAVLKAMDKENEALELTAQWNDYLIKHNAAKELGVSVEQLNELLNTSNGLYKDLDEKSKAIVDKARVQLETSSINRNSSSSKSSSSDKKESNPLLEWFNDENTKEFMALGEDTFNVMADSISMMMDWAITEAEEKLNEVTELHDKAVGKVEESQTRIAELNDKMKDASGSRLEAYKQQLADEVLLQQQREAEEKRLAKEKEKREKELQKREKDAAKAEVKMQIAQAIVNTSMGVTKAFAQFGFPMGPIFGAILSTLGTIQVAMMAKQLSKMASGGVLGGREHKDGGNPVPSMGVEVEKGEAVINKRSTAKYLPLLDAINAEGNGGKHTLLQTRGNVIKRYADGGVLNYQRIDDNFNRLSEARAIERAINSIDFHPVVSVQEISRVQRNIVEVRELSGARN